MKNWCSTRSPARRAGAAQVELVGDMDAVPAYLAPSLEPGDVVLILGAGNINRIAGPLLAQMEALGS